MPPTTIYSAPLEPDLSDSITVLAFLLAPTRAFCDAAEDDAHTFAVVDAMLHNAKRQALMEWYRLYLRRTTTR